MTEASGDLRPESGKGLIPWALDRGANRSSSSLFLGQNSLRAAAAVAALPPPGRKVGGGWRYTYGPSGEAHAHPKVHTLSRLSGE